MAGSNGGRSSRNSNNSSNEFYRGMVQSYIEKVRQDSAVGVLIKIMTIAVV